MNSISVFSSTWVAKTLGLLEAPHTFLALDFTRIISDSRKVQPGDLFIALVGEKMDGHDYVTKALDQGATGVIVHQDIPGLEKYDGKANIYLVADTLKAYRALGHAWRKNFDIPVIAITGSVGKTTTKELITGMLKGANPSVLKTEGSQNGFVGIPMTLLELRDTHTAAVIEIGIDDIGAMKPHMELVEPTACLLTAIGPEHLEKLKDIATVTREEMISLEWTVRQGGKIAINEDDTEIHHAAAKLKGPGTFRFSLKSRDADFYGVYDSEKQTLEVTEKNGSQTLLELPLPGAHNAANALGAFAMARALGMGSRNLAIGLATQFKAADGRSRWVDLSHGRNWILCDYYNANPASVAAAIEVLVQRKSNGKRWVCLGDMLELGPGELDFHRALAPLLEKHSIHHVLLFGPRQKALAETLQSKGFKGQFAHFENIDQLSNALIHGLKPGDTCLIKGSRSMKMERVWKTLHERFENQGP